MVFVGMIQNIPDKQKSGYIYDTYIYIHRRKLGPGEDSPLSVYTGKYSF